MLQRLNSAQPVTAVQYNRLVDAINSLLGMKVAPPLELHRAAGQYQLRVTAAGFMAKVTSKSDGSGGKHLYGVTEVQPEPGGEWATKPGGRTLSNVTEWNDHVIAVGTVVRVEPFDNDDWRCWAVDPCGIAEDIAGLGLAAELCEDSGDCCPKLDVLQGCHVLVQDDGVHVDVDTMVDGVTLVVAPVECSDSGDCCPPIMVNSVCKEVVVPGTITATCNDDGTITIDYETEWVRVLDGADCSPSASGSGSGSGSGSESPPPPDYYCVSPAGTGDPSSCVAFASGSFPDPGTWDYVAGPFPGDTTCGGGCP